MSSKTSIINPNRREKLAIYLCVASFVIGTFLITFGIICPPPGEVHSSVLVAVGEFLGFCGAILGIQAFVKGEVKSELEDLKTDIIRRLNSEEQ